MLSEKGSVSVSDLTSWASRMRLYKQTPETSLGAKVDHQAPLFVDTHAGWVQRSCKNQKIKPTHTQRQQIPVLKQMSAESRSCNGDVGS